jgi:hypothetical protein
MIAMFPEAWSAEYAEERAALDQFQATIDAERQAAQHDHRPAWQRCTSCGGRVTAAEQIVGYCGLCARQRMAA